MDENFRTVNNMAIYCARNEFVADKIMEIYKEIESSGVLTEGRKNARAHLSAACDELWNESKTLRRTFLSGDK